MQNLFQTFIARISHWLARPSREIGFLSTPFGAVATCTGEVRKENQDRVVVANFTGTSEFDSFTAWLLCDGIGGLRDGNAAAEHAIASILVGLIARGNLQKPNAVEDVVQQANRHVFERLREQGGSTLSLVVSSVRSSFAINVGDSRIYRLEKQRVVQLSSDDTIGNELRLLAGSGAQVSGGLFAHHLSQYLGLGGDLVLKPILQFRLDEGDTIILTSDGVHSLDSRVLDGILVSAPSPLETVKRLVYVSKWRGGKDNASVICFPAKFPERSRAEPGLLQIWDAFSTLEMFIDRSSLPLAPKTDRAPKPEGEQKAKRAPETSESAEDSTEAESELGKRRQRRGHGKADKNPEVEIIENIQGSAS
jgi:PPM family protein phosphatase